MANIELLQQFVKRDPLFQFQFNEKEDAIKYLKGDLANARSKASKDIQAAAKGFLKNNVKLFGSGSFEKLDVLAETADPNGGVDLVYQQFHGKARVYGGSVRFHFSRDGTLDTVSNRLFSDLAKLSKEPKIDAQKAVSAAQKKLKVDQKESRNPELLVYRVDGRPFLVWEVMIDSKKINERGTPSQWIAYVDASSGNILEYYDNIQTVAVIGNGTGYYSGAGTVNAWSTGATFQLRDTTRTALVPAGPEIITNDEDGTSPSSDADSNWNESVIPPRNNHQGPEVDAHRYAGAVADYFRNVHGRNGFNGMGGNFISVCHAGNDMSNGFWNGSNVQLGDGTGVAATGDDFECSDDWLAHEFTHAYTQFTCGLQYLNESGALNEAFSDIFAAFITGDWFVFEDTWIKASAPAWRNMIDPTNSGNWNLADPLTSVLAGHQPSHYSVKYVGGIDNGGVHINSGIINNLFYLLTVGGTHTVSGVVVTGIGQPAAEQMLFRCMTVNLVGKPNATFLDFREAMLDACLDLFPTDLVKLTQVKNAFHAVGIGPDLYVRDNLADTGLEPYTGSFLYASPDVINRQAASANPAVDFADLNNDALWQNVEFGQNNFVYVRLQNRGAANGDATINVYFIPMTSFGAPAGWIHIGTLMEAGIAPGSLRIAGPLTFPKALIPAAGQHYCMIAVVTSALDPAPDHNLITTVSDYLYFVANTNNIAYRNMDVVDLLPNLPGVLEVEIQKMGRLREVFEVQIDLARFVPGARILVRGPRNALDGAVPRGLKLVERGRTENLYQLLLGQDLILNDNFLRPLAEPGKIQYGFEHVLVEKPFKLKVEYVLPKEDIFNKIDRRLLKRGFQLVVRQLIKGQTLGSAGLNFRSKQ